MWELAIGAAVAYVLYTLLIVQPAQVPDVNTPGTKPGLDSVGTADTGLESTSGGNAITTGTATGGVARSVFGGSAAGNIAGGILGVGTLQLLGNATGIYVDNVAGETAAGVGGAVVGSVGLGTLISTGSLWAAICTAGPYALVAAFIVVGAAEIYDVYQSQTINLTEQNLLQNMENKWQTVYAQTISVLQTLFPGKDNTVYHRCAVNFADGFVTQSNRIAYLSVVKPPIDVGADINAGLLSGVNTVVQGVTSLFGGGVATGPTDFATNAALQRVGPDIQGRYFGTVYLAGADGKPLRTGSYNSAYGDNGFVLVPSFTGVANGFGTAQTISAWQGSWVDHALRSDYLQIVGLSVDTEALPYRAVGVQVCNACHFVNQMTGSWGIGQSETSTMVYGIQNGLYEGTINPAPFSWQTQQNNLLKTCSGPASLVYGGDNFYWRTTDLKTGVCRRYNPVTAAGF